MLGFSITINTLFQALGHGVPATILSLSRQGFFFIPALFLFSDTFKLQGLFMAQPTADALTFVLTALLFFYVYREIKELEKLDSQKGTMIDLKYEQKSA